MNNTRELKDKFEKLKARSLKKDASIYGTDLWGKWHNLAVRQYEPAKEFFIERLHDVRPDWRRASVSLLGFHYELEDHILEIIRNLLINDADPGVRISAASVLGSQGRFLENSLVNALVHDPDPFVRRSAFSALLDLAGVPYKVKLEEEDNIRSKKITPSLDQVKRILHEQNLLTKISLLEEWKG